MSSGTESESEQSASEIIEDNENRLSDEEFPISEDEAEAEITAQGGWAGMMAKVLKSDKTAVLSKAKKVEDVAKKKEKKSFNFQVVGAEEEIIKTEEEEKPEEKALKRALEKRKLRERREVNFHLKLFKHEFNFSCNVSEQTSCIQSAVKASSHRLRP